MDFSNVVAIAIIWKMDYIAAIGLSFEATEARLRAAQSVIFMTTVRMVGGSIGDTYPAAVGNPQGQIVWVTSNQRTPQLLG